MIRIMWLVLGDNWIKNVKIVQFFAIFAFVPVKKWMNITYFMYLFRNHFVINTIRMNGCLRNGMFFFVVLFFRSWTRKHKVLGTWAVYSHNKIFIKHQRWWSATTRMLLHVVVTALCFIHNVCLFVAVNQLKCQNSNLHSRKVDFSHKSFFQFTPC